MKTFKLFFSFAILAFVFASCQPETEVKTTVVDFENVQLNQDSISNLPSFKVGDFSFSVIDSAFWNGGIVCSEKRDTITPGPGNQYSSVTASGALNSKKYGVVYAPGAIVCPANANGSYSIKSIMLTNSTYAYLDMMNGSLYGKKFVAGDWFKLIIKGFKSKVQTASIEVYLADFRNGKSEILKTWKKVDLSSMNEVDSISFNFDSTDKGAWGMNTPAYVCIDNIEFTQTISTK